MQYPAESAGIATILPEQGNLMIAAPSKRRKQLYALLGDLPPRQRRITAQKLWENFTENYVLEKLVLDLNGFEPVPAYLVRPQGEARPRPTILYNHWHGGQYEVGKEMLLEKRFGLPPYADDLTRRGYNVLCGDHWTFGERRGRKELEIFKEMLWEGQVMWGMMVYDSLRATDYLCTRPEVDRKRLGTTGMSMDSTMAWWLAALDTRLKVCVDLCCLTDYHALIEDYGLDRHGVYYYVPRLLKFFTTAQINALIAPRPHLSLAGNKDGLTPTAGLDRIDRELKQIYQSLSAADGWKLLRYDVGHVETPEMRAEVLAFLENG